MQTDPEQTPLEDMEPDDDRTQPEFDSTATKEADPSQPDEDPTETFRQVTVQEAAGALGITVEAVRARLRRGTLSKEKASDGTVYVRLVDNKAQLVDDQAGARGRSESVRTTGAERREDRMHDWSRIYEGLVEALREQIEVLRSELEDRKEEARRKDAIIMSLSQRFPELPPSAPREAPVDPPVTAPPTAQEESRGRRSWFVRFFFGP